MKKNTLIFIEDGSYTYDNRIKREAKALNENGWDVTVICPRFDNDKFFQKINPNLRIFFYPKINGNSIFEHLVEHMITMFFGSLIIFFVSIHYRFRIFHACNPTDILWILYLPYKLFGVRFIFDQHDLCPELYLSRPNTSKNNFLFRSLCWFEKKSYKYSSSVITTNQSYKKIAIERGGLNENKVFVVRNGPLIEKFDLSNLRNTISSNITVGYVGNMNLQDGVEDIIDVCNIILGKFKRLDINFLLIGGGANQPKLKSEVKNRGLDKYISFTGRISDEEMLNRLFNCEFCIQPDPFNPLNNLSTMNKIMEYMALGKTFVAYDLKETRITGADCGLYSKNNSQLDMARNIIKLADDKKLCKILGQKGRKRIENELKWDYSIPNLYDAYLNALSN